MSIPDEELVALLRSLLERFTELTKVVSEHQAYVFALQSYVEAQPGYNVLLWNQLMAKYRTQGQDGFDRDAQKAADALLARLKDFEGPPQ